MNCTDCKHYYVTWDRDFPRGCRAFKIKSQRWPAEEVLAATGQKCEVFAAKADAPPKTGRKRQKAIGSC